MKRLVAIGAVAAACVVQPSFAESPISLEQLLGSNPSSAESSGIPELRFNALREIALAYGARAGLAKRSEEIQKTVYEPASRYMDSIYAFQALMIDGYVMPPVLVTANEIYDQKSDDLLRVIDKMYRIEKQAEFVYLPPTWRTYLMMPYKFSLESDLGVTPKDDKERELWNQWIKKGWGNGVEQANKIAVTNMNRLRRDFEGMILYHELYAKKMVSKPYIASSALGVTGSDSVMNVNEMVLRITAKPQFDRNDMNWKGSSRNE